LITSVFGPLLRTKRISQDALSAHFGEPHKHSTTLCTCQFFISSTDPSDRPPRLPEVDFLPMSEDRHLYPDPFSPSSIISRKIKIFFIIFQLLSRAARQHSDTSHLFWR